jgi:GNAT superfamily N-acetyltransferase
MTGSARAYDHATDYARVGEFLVRTYRPSGRHVNWLQPRWEYMHYHPLVRNVDLNTIGVWEADGEIVGVVHPEHSMGMAYFELDPRYGALREEMLTWAEDRISAVKDGVRTLHVYVTDDDRPMQKLVAKRGYAQCWSEATSHYSIPVRFPAISLPSGFRLRSLADENDLRQVSRVCWRGFDHGDEPPEGDDAERAFMQTAPNFRKDLNVVVVAPDGNCVSYCGMWYEPVHRVAYVEPVCTDPAYRRMGLASAAVREGIRRCGEQGATVACVGTDKPLYLSLGFRPVYRETVCKREWV